MNQPAIPYEVIDGVKNLKRSDWWRLGYRVQRYLSYLTSEELHERLVDVFTNLTTLTPEGQIGLPPIKGETLFPWMELWAHILEEYGLRGSGLPGGFISDCAIPNASAPIPAKGTQELLQRSLSADGRLIKYGNYSWLKETLDTGKWRISPASYYTSNSLCEARKDFEMELRVCVPYFERHSQASDVLDENYPDTLHGVKRLRIAAYTDFYIACFARTFIHRLFDDFDSDSCLIVMDEDVFTRRMTNAFKQFRPRWRGVAGRVSYVDPVVPKTIPDIFFAKHFRYAYQDEFRFVWIPDPHIAKLQPAFLELGSLHDCCELLPLAATKVA